MYAMTNLKRTHCAPKGTLIAPASLFFYQLIVAMAHEGQEAERDAGKGVEKICTLS
jgi:hypothetical protein